MAAADPQAEEAERLVREAARAGDRERVAGLLMRHFGPRVLGAVKRRVGAADADDAFQEAVIAVVHKLCDGHDIRSVEGYLLGAAVFQAERIRTSWWSRLFRGAGEPEQLAGPDPRAEPEEADSFDVAAALDALPAEQRMVMEMRLRGLAHEDIARILRKSEAAVMQIASRATAKLRQLAQRGGRKSNG